MPYTVVAVDLGSTSSRVYRGVFDDGRLQIEICSQFETPAASVRTSPYDAPGIEDGVDRSLRWDVLSLWQSIRHGLRRAARLGPVDSVGIDGWAIDYAILDAEGELVGNPRTYRTATTSKAVEEVHAKIPESDLYQWNGLQDRWFTTIFQLVAAGRRPQIQLADRILLLPDLFAYWLTGATACEVTNASTTGLLDPRTRQWSQPIIEVLADSFGLPVPGALPPLVEPGRTIGVVDEPDLNLHTRTGEPTPLLAVVAHDIASAVAGTPALGAGPVGFVYAGTWSPIGVELDRVVTTEAAQQARFTNELGVDDTVCFLKNSFGLWLSEECLRAWQREEGQEVTALIVEVEAEVAEPFRTLFDVNHPSLAAPPHMPAAIDAVAAAAAEPTPRTRGGYIRAIIESLVVTYRRALREAQQLSDTRIEVVHIGGSGSSIDLLCQLTADATGLPVIAGPPEGAALGNMLVQLRAAGVIGPTLADMRGVVAASFHSRRFEPTKGADAVWQRAETRVFGD